MQNKHLLATVLLCKLLCLTHLLDQLIDATGPLLICSKQYKIFNFERFVTPELLCKSKVAVNMNKWHIAKSADVMLAQHKDRRDLVFLQLFQYVAKRDYRLAARPRIVKEIAS